MAGLQGGPAHRPRRAALGRGLLSGGGAPPLRPLFVLHTGVPGGSGAVQSMLLDHRPEAVTPACAFLGDGPLRADVAARGIAVALVDSGRARELWRGPGVIRRLAGLIRRHRADVVVSQGPKAQFFGGPAARLAGVPAMWWQHDVPGAQPMLHRVAERAGAAVIVCPSEYTAEMQRARTPHRRIVALHNGVEIAERRAESTPPLRVGAVARLQRYKRLELFVDAAAAVHRELPDVRFEIAGGASGADEEAYAAELRRRAHDAGLGDALAFPGHVPGGADHIATFDLLVHTAEHEPFGLVVAEAMMRGVVALVPRAGGPAEIVRDGIDGLHVDVADRDALAGALAGLLRDPERRRTMGDAARERALECFTAGEMAAESWALMGAVARRTAV